MRRLTGCHIKLKHRGYKLGWFSMLGWWLQMPWRLFGNTLLDTTMMPGPISSSMIIKPQLLSRKKEMYLKHELAKRILTAFMWMSDQSYHRHNALWTAQPHCVIVITSWKRCVHYRTFGIHQSSVVSRNGPVMRSFGFFVVVWIYSRVIRELRNKTAWRSYGVTLKPLTCGDRVNSV